MSSVYIDIFVDPADAIVVRLPSTGVGSSIVIEIGSVAKLFVDRADLVRLHTAIGEHLDATTGGTS